MDTITPEITNSSEPQEQIENKSKKHIGGFNTQPENINRQGRPSRSWTWKSELEKAMEEALKDGKPIKHHLARSLIREALKGNVRAIEQVMDRMDGKSMQQIDHTTLGEKMPGPVVYQPAEDKNE